MSDVRGPAVTDLATAQAVIATLQAELTQVQRENASHRHQLDVLCQRLFGKKSERVDPRQLQLALEQLANEPGPVTEPIEMDSGDTPVREHQLLYSLVQSCKLIDVPPFEYLRDVLLRVATHPQRLIGELTPKGWTATFARRAAA